MARKIEDGKRPTFRMLSGIEFAKPDAGAERRFRINAYTGAKVETWWGSLVIDVAGMAMKEKMPILREHARDRVVGWGEEFKKEGGQLVIEGPFSKSTKDAEEVLKLADEGFPWQASVGVWPKRVEMVNKGQFEANGKTYEGPCEVWRESFVGETSFCSIGADSDTAAISMSGFGEHRVEIEQEVPETTQTKEVKEMTKEQLQAEHPEVFKQICDEAALAAVTAERSRIGEIRASAFPGMEELTEKFVSEGASPDEARKGFIAAEKAKKQDRIETLKKESPASTGANTETGDALSQLPEGEERWKAEFSRSQSLQDEFGRVEAYIGFKKADKRGSVRIFKKQ